MGEKKIEIVAFTTEISTVMAQLQFSLTRKSIQWGPDPGFFLARDQKSKRQESKTVEIKKNLGSFFCSRGPPNKALTFLRRS